MIKLILTAIAAVAGLALWLFKRYWSIDAKKRSIKGKIEKIRQEMRQALFDGRHDDYGHLLAERGRLLDQLRNLR